LTGTFKDITGKRRHRGLLTPAFIYALPYLVHILHYQEPSSQKMEGHGPPVVNENAGRRG
jgi:hypothetical protein